MRYRRPHWRFLTAPSGLAAPCGAAVLALLLAGLAPARALAQASDPVENMRALLPTRVGDDAYKPALAEREAKLTKAAANLKTLSDLRRALVLSEWKDNDTVTPNIMVIDQKVRSSIGARFAKIVE